MSQAASSTSLSDPGMPARPLGRRLLLAGLAAPLAGCGFRPLNGPPAPGEAAAAPELAAVRIGRTVNRTGQLLHQALERRLAAGDRSSPAARYELTVSALPAYEAQGYRRDGAPSRFRMTMTAPWTLQTLSVPPRPVAAGTARAFDSYNFLDSEFYASLLSSEAAERRLVEQIAEDIVLRLTLAFRGNPTA
jgi:hypothetical protein